MGGFTRTWDAFDKNVARILANTDRKVYFNSGTLLSELELSDVTKSPFLTMMEEGYTNARPMISMTRKLPGIAEETQTYGVRLTAYPGWGVQTAPLSEKAIWGLRKPGILSKEAWGNFLKDVRGTMTETIQITKPTSIFSGGGGFSRELRSLSIVSMNVPSDIMGKGLTTGLYAASLYGFGEIKSVHQKPDVIMNQVSKRITIPKSIQRSIQLPTQDIMQVSLQDVVQYPLQKQVSIQEQMQEQIQKTIQEQVQIQEPMQMQEQKQVQIYDYDFGQEQIKLVIFPLPSKKRTTDYMNINSLIDLDDWMFRHKSFPVVESGFLKRLNIKLPKVKI